MDTFPPDEPGRHDGDDEPLSDAEEERLLGLVRDALRPASPRRHGIAELLTLMGQIRRLAFGNLPPIEALGRIRDAFREYDGDA